MLPAKQVASAIRYMLEEHARGKVVIQIQPNFA
jgi:hypothetical protein